MPWQEDRLHRWLAARTPARALVGSPMSDAAVLRPLAGRLVACCDQTVEGVHFEPGERAALVGHKAAGRVLSDLAASAALPAHLTLSLCAPRAASERWMRAAIEGVARAAREVGAELVGGDLCCSEGPIALSVHATGHLPGTRRAPGRDRARAGQLIVLTGPVGGSRLGRHLRIVARIEAGRRLFAGGATAMMDVSDGLAWDLFRLARASRVRFEIERVPVHRDARRQARASGRSALWHALNDGEDHELIATLSAPAFERLRAAGFAGQAIGRVRAGQGLWLPGQEEPDSARARDLRAWRPERDRGGWRHAGS